MKLQYLGTAAAEGWPALFCDCDACRRAAAQGGRNIRTRSQAIIDDRLLIDFPPDTLYHVHTHGLKLYTVRHCLLTHSHPDHLYSEDLGMRRTGYAYFEDTVPLTIYGGKAVETKVVEVMKETGLDKSRRMRFCPVLPFEPVEIDGYTVIPLPANHALQIDTSLIYQISGGGKTMLYANDTGWFLPDTWKWLAEARPHYDFISLDCTAGSLDYRDEHMGQTVCVELMEELRRIGCADRDTVFCLHHFSHNGLWTYDELVPIAAEKGMLVSYDGMVVEI